MSTLSAIVGVALILIVLGDAFETIVQAELTFAIARHALVDLSLIFRSPPRKPGPDRLSSAQLKILRSGLAAVGLKLPAESAVESQLTELRRLYEPYLHSLSTYLRFSIPPWIPESSWTDNWRTSPWRTDWAVREEGPSGTRSPEHF